MANAHVCVVACVRRAGTLEAIVLDNSQAEVQGMLILDSQDNLVDAPGACMGRVHGAGFCM